MGCIDNAAYEEAARKQADAIQAQALTDTLIYAALALWQRNSSSSITNMQTEISDRQLKLAEAISNHAKAFWPYEINLLDDAFGETKANPQYAALSNQWGSLVDNALSRGRTDWLAEMERRCLSPTRCEAARWDRHAQNIRADMISYADRQGEARAETLNDLRYARQLAVLAIGKDQILNVPSYQSIAGQVGAQASATVVGLIDAARTTLGYSMARNRHDGWATGYIGQFEHRMGYEPPRREQPVQVNVQTFPVTPAVNPVPMASDPCGPMPGPDASDAEWRRWDACKGNK